MRKKILTRQEHVTKTKKKKILNILLRILLVVISLKLIVICIKKITGIANITMEKINNHICSVSIDLFFWELYVTICLVMVLYTLIFYFSQKKKMKKRR